MKVNILEAKNQLSRLIKSAQTGEEVIIANRGEPVAQLVPVKPSASKDTIGSGPAIVAWMKAHPLPVHARRSAEEIDADIQAERDAWE